MLDRSCHARFVSRRNQVLTRWKHHRVSASMYTRLILAATPLRKALESGRPLSILSTHPTGCARCLWSERLRHARLRWTTSWAKAKLKGTLQVGWAVRRAPQFYEQVYTDFYVYLYMLRLSAYRVHLAAGFLHVTMSHVMLPWPN